MLCSRFKRGLKNMRETIVQASGSNEKEKMFGIATEMPTQLIKKAEVTHDVP